jgi:hypothetical protein
VCGSGADVSTGAAGKNGAGDLFYHWLMQKKFLGDCNDIVKRAVLQALPGSVKWSVHPMLTEKLAATDLAEYQTILGAESISEEILTAEEEPDEQGRRVNYFRGATSREALFIDPDMGLRANCERRRRQHFLFPEELVWLVGERPQHLTIVFDLGDGRGNEESHLKPKLRYLLRRGVAVFAYCGHPSFIIAGANESTVDAARSRLRQGLALPSHRLVSKRDL